MTDPIKRKLQEEINTLEHELIHELPKEIKKAAALGDLSENAEYHMAKQRQEFVKARVRQLGKRLAELSMINMNNIPHDKVGLGSTVKVFDNTKNEEIEYKLVTSEESDVAAGKISTTSPIGRALLNKKVGDEATVVTPNGKRELEILSLSTIHDEVDENPKRQAHSTRKNFMNHKDKNFIEARLRMSFLCVPLVTFVVKLSVRRVLPMSTPGPPPSAAPAESSSTPSFAGWLSPASIPTSSLSWDW